MLRCKKQFFVCVATIIGMLFVALSCKKDNPEYKTPLLSLKSSEMVDLAPGEKTEIKLTLNGDGGAKSVIVKKNGGFLKEFPVHATASEFIYTTEPISVGQEEGAEVKYGFTLVNQNDVESPEVLVVTKVALYDKITIGSTSLFSLKVGTEGIVPSGKSVKLIKGRNYFIPTSLTFEVDSSLEIEEGVQVYMNAEAKEKVSINVSGTAKISGTVTNPVVITSSKVLSDASKASAGDWGRFALIGAGAKSDNGKISYLRLEYGGDRVFRLSDVGSKTQISHIQVFNSEGEGFMITDGNAQLKYLVATDCRGGSYRLGEKYEGKIQFAISVNSARFDENDDFVIREEASPVIANITLLGAGKDTDKTNGMRMRAKAAPKVYNSVIANFPRRGLRAGDDVNITDLKGSAVFAYSYIFDVETDAFRGDAQKFAGTFNIENGNIETNPFYNNAVNFKDKIYTLKAIAGIGVADFVPDVEQTSEFNPASLDTFFTSVTYVGAIKNGSEDWTKGWVKNPDNSVR